MSKKSKRTSAPAPMEIPRPVAQPVGAPGTQPVPPPSIPTMFGPGMWCPPRPPQCLPPSSAPYWFGGGVQQPGVAGSSAQQPGMAGSSAQGAWWTPAVAGIGGSRHSWPAADSQEDSDMLAWGLDSHPPGGFLNILKSTPQPTSNRTASQAIHIDSDNNDAGHSRSEKRLTWTKEEDLKLVSAWLMNSNDPIQANYKKNDQYWNGVADGFNKTVPKNRVRSAKQVKDHWWRIKLRVGWFCGNWKEADAMWGSGESEEDVMKKALQSYEEDHKKDGPFVYRHCWEVLSKEPKWEAYLERLKDLEPEKRKFSVDEELEQQFSLDDVRDDRPMGGRKAKELRKKKKKNQPSIIDIEDELHSFLDAQKAANEGRKEMLETQRHVSSEKLESRRLADLAAKENKEAVMLETYRSLLTQDTTGMDEDVKAEHVLALRCLRESLFKKITKDLHIWHAFFGVAGSNNDLNVLNQSPLFLDALKGEAPQVQFSVNGNEYRTGYYLADGIYPEWAAFMKSITLPQTEKHQLFAEHQEGARKDVERAFGVLQSRFAIIRRPARLWKRKSIGRIMLACVILHNMIVEDEREDVNIHIDLNENPGASFALPPEVNTSRNPRFADVMLRKAAIRDRPQHTQLKNDLIEHIWCKFGNRQRN